MDATMSLKLTETVQSNQMYFITLRRSSTTYYIYTVSQKISHLMFNNNFGKCGPIFKILWPVDLISTNVYV